MIVRGAFGDQRVELIRGEIVESSPQGPAHSILVRRLHKLLAASLMRASLFDKVDITVQSPFAASFESEPEPDVAIIRPSDDISDHPDAALLVIEVADSSLEFDRREKARIYAESGVPEYWIVNVGEQVIEVQRVPEAGAYREASIAIRGDVLRSSALSAVDVEVERLFRGFPRSGV